MTNSPASMTLYGFPVVESLLCADVPRFTLSAEVPVTQEFRDSFNQWAREFFGTGDVTYTVRNPVTGKTSIFVSPRTAATLRGLATYPRSKA